MWSIKETAHVLCVADRNTNQLKPVETSFPRDSQFHNLEVLQIPHPETEAVDALFLGNTG